MRLLAQRFFWCETTFETVVYRTRGYAQALGPMSNRKSLTLKGDKACRSSIDGLLNRRRPSAVSGFVIATIFNSLNRMFSRRFCSHVVHEGLDGVHPSFADCNPSSSVTLEILPVGICASRDHGLPRPIFSGLVKAVGAIVKFGSRGDCFSPETPATRGVTVTKVTSPNRLHLSTRAFANPIGLLGWPTIKAFHGKASVNMTRQINKTGHNLIYHTGIFQGAAI